MIQKKGYYLIMDSLIAVFILVLGIFLAASSGSSKPQQETAKHYAKDIAGLLGSAKITGLCSTSSCACSDGKLANLCSNSKIKNFNNTLIELIGELHFRGEGSEIGPLVESIVANNTLIPDGFGLSLALYEKTGSASLDFEYYRTHSNSIPPGREMESARSIIQSKKVVFGFWEEPAGLNYWGPYTIEVRVWQK